MQISFLGLTILCLRWIENAWIRGQPVFSGSLWAHEGDSAWLGGWFWDHFEYKKVALGHYGVTLGSLWHLGGDFGMILSIRRWLWVNMGWLGVTLASLWGYFGGTFGVRGRLWLTLGSLWGHFGPLWGHSKLALGSLWKHSGHMRVTLGPFGVNLGWLCCYFWRMRVTSSHSGVQFVAFWIHFGVIFGYFGYMKMTLGQFESSLESFQVTSGIRGSAFGKHSFFQLILMILLKTYLFPNSFWKGIPLEINIIWYKMEGISLKIGDVR